MSRCDTGKLYLYQSTTAKLVLSKTEMLNNINYNNDRHVWAYGKGQLGLQHLSVRAFKNFVAIIKIGSDAVCLIHVSTVLTNQSVNQYQLFIKVSK